MPTRPVYESSKEDGEEEMSAGDVVDYLGPMVTHSALFGIVL